MVCIIFRPAVHLELGCMVGYRAIMDMMVKRESPGVCAGN